ncbi:superfamily II DNA/RNA helicase [Rhodoligotrophos appendicifer]|uniref:DEAD/DEAH box helicase n=1 Tax=Rhodoligotrophos appendicifer TaxID=987056 RepID=UPI00118677F0|nr:DEAD/DEAH box helicase [Rhodoligotrophos appendicifer]
MSFDDLGLSPRVLDAVKAAGYTEPTPIQAQAIPPALEQRDVLGLAQTGSGKTAAFTLPMLTLLERGRARARMPRALILEPTRELAAQVYEAFETFGKNHKMTIALLIGGVSFNEQDKKIDRGADVVIATPGRLMDHYKNGKLMLNGVQLFVVDEADRMLDMGFIPDIEEICKMLPMTRQTLFFSATMPPEIQRLTSTFLQNPFRVEASPPSSTAASIVQRLVQVPSEAASKRDALRNLLRDQSETINNAIVFSNRKETVKILEKSMKKHGFNAAALHGDMDQHSRLQTLEKFRGGEISFLIASDVAARGLDIPAVSHVFNFDVPIHAEDYVHRIGRTGRAGREGFAFMLVTRNETKQLNAIEKLIQKQIEWAGPSLAEPLPELDRGDRPETGRRRGAKGEERGRREPRARAAPRGRVDRGDQDMVVELAAAAPVEAAPISPEQPKVDVRPEVREERPRRNDDRRRGRDQQHEIGAIEGALSFKSQEIPAFLLRSVR